VNLFKVSRYIVGLTLLFLMGCATVKEGAFNKIIKSVAPKAEKQADGNYVLPEFSSADTGIRFSTSSPGTAMRSLGQILTPMEEDERFYFARVFTSLAHYHGCVQKGYKSYSHATSAFKIDRKPSQCSVITFFGDSHNFAKVLLEEGRPDSDDKRVVQQTLAGAPIGDARIVGRTTTESWAQWIAWSGHNLNGKTRSELLQEFLQQSEGTLARF